MHDMKRIHHKYSKHSRQLSKDGYPTRRETAIESVCRNMSLPYVCCRKSNAVLYHLQTGNGKNIACTFRKTFDSFISKDAHPNWILKKNWKKDSVVEGDNSEIDRECKRQK